MQVEGVKGWRREMFGGVYVGTVCHWIMNYTNMYGYICV